MLHLRVVRESQSPPWDTPGQRDVVLVRCKGYIQKDAPFLQTVGSTLVYAENEPQSLDGIAFLDMATTCICQAVREAILSMRQGI